MRRAAREAVRLLFLLSHAGLFRNFDSTLRELARRGHEVHVSFDSERYPSAAFDALVAEHENVTAGLTPPVADDRWAALGRHVRAGSDYFRYLDPRYEHATKLRERARRQVPPWLRWAARDGGAPRADRWLRAVERRLPLSETALEFVRSRSPDLVAVSPLFGSAAQLEVLRAARALGVSTCLPVASWDNLSNKGLIRELPNTVLVWNETQRREAAELQGVPVERVIVTGAQNFDEWFERSPSASREELLGRVGLAPGRPYLLYLGSSSFIAPDEAEFVVEWLAALRRHSNATLREAGVLIRPHPQNARQYDRRELRDDPQVTVWPPPDLAPQQTGRADWSREDFYDSMHHAAAVVGVNTTAMIESAVVGRCVYTMLHPRFRETQEGTIHFEYLRSVNGGLLHLSRSFDEHFGQLAEALRAPPGVDERARRFVEAFVRPHGIDRPATPIVVDALEAADGARSAQGATAAAPWRATRRPPLALEPLAAMAAAVDRAGSRRRRRGRRARGLARRLAPATRRG